MTKKLTRRAVVGGLAAGLVARRARAEGDWPTRTITVIHGFPAGGPSDVIARLLADGLGRALGQAVIVESRPGASGTVAAGLVARAAPDGYTLSVIPSGHASAAATFASLPYRSVDDFTTISLASEYPYVMATHIDSGFKSVAGLVAAAKKRPGALLYGTPGVGSGPQLAIELFALQTKIKVTHVPYRGSAPAVMELLAGRLDFMMDPPATMMEFIGNGKLRALAVSSLKPYFALPSAPTIAESGVPGFDVSAWQGLIAPAGLSERILKRLNAETVRILNDPATVERMHTFGNEASPSTPEQFKKRLVDDIAKWTAVADEIHFQKI
ncbi:MAG TPA: tripartite tricarboxylate transporter substrate binding protein [Xanthobacteraceae bacterium]|nr:tripartite tricarboxylate transporter substrate binding protein [Xanthobacteraceae bacterium]